MRKELSVPSKNSEHFEDRIFEFLELSQKMLTLAKHENAILKSCGFSTMEAYLKHRSALLRDYKENAQILIEDSISEAVQTDVRNILASELLSVQNALKDNAAYDFNKIQDLRSLDLKDGDRKWH